MIKYSFRHTLRHENLYSGRYNAENNTVRVITVINTIAVKTTSSRLTNAVLYYSTRSAEPVIKKNIFLFTVKRFPTVRSHHVRLECKGLVANNCEWKDRIFSWQRPWWKSFNSSSNQTVQALNACHHSTWNVVESNSRS